MSTSTPAPADLLGRLSPGRSANFWMATFKNGTVCVATPASNSKSYVRKINSMLRSNGLPESMHQGVLSRLTSGNLVLSIKEDIDAVGKMYASLCREEGNQKMPNIAIVEIRQAQIARAGSVENIAEDVASLRGLSAGGRGVFCIVASKDRSPCLIIGTDKAALTDRINDEVSRRTLPARTLYGQLKRLDDGTVAMRSKHTVERLQRLVAAFIDAHIQNWPEVAILRDARFHSVR